MRSWTFLVIAAPLALELMAAPSGIPASLFMQGREVDAVPVTLARFHGRRVRVFDRQVAYRNDRKACVRFEMPPELPLTGTPLRLELEAYNDDSVYLRALWFEVDGIGGYLAVQQVAKGQHRGDGTIGAGERKRWVMPLNHLALSLGAVCRTHWTLSLMGGIVVPHATVRADIHGVDDRTHPRGGSSGGRTHARRLVAAGMRMAGLA